MSYCAMCGTQVPAKSTHPDIVFCTTNCRDNWLNNAITEDLRVLQSYPKEKFISEKIDNS